MERPEINRFLAAGIGIWVMLAVAMLAGGPAFAITITPPSTDNPSTTGTAIKVETQPIRWNPKDRNDVKAGELEWAGSIEIKSDDANFGGWSSLVVSADGTTLVAVSDKAHWMSAHILYDEKGRISGLANVSIAPLLDLDGKPIKTKAMGDAESLTIAGDDPLIGDAYVSFERFHRIWRYALGQKGFAAQPVQLVTARRLGPMPSNGGIEALTTLLPETGGDNQKLLALTEDAREPRGDRKAFITQGRDVKRLTTKPDDPYKPTDITRLPNGDFLVLERSFSVLAGPGMALRLIKAADVKPGANLEGRLLMQANSSRLIDNMEGVSARRETVGSDKGQTLIYVLSDDNFNPLQHTYLMMFRMKAGGPEKAAAKTTTASTHRQGQAMAE